MQVRWGVSCGGRLRSRAEIAIVLREWAPVRRALSIECDAQYRAYGWRRTPQEVELAADEYLTHIAERDLAALALELEGQHCWGCAQNDAEAFTWRRQLVFVGLLAGCAGRDERAEEEFEFLRVAA